MGKQKLESVWRGDSLMENVSIYEFEGFPQIHAPNSCIAIVEIFIEWVELRVGSVAAVLTTNAVDFGPENPFQEIHFICQDCEKKVKPNFYHCQPTQKIPYIIQNHDLEQTQFKIIPISDKKLPKIKRILLKIEITNADSRF